MHTQLCAPCRQWWGRTTCFQKSRQYPWSSRHETRPYWRISQSVWLRVLWTQARVWRKRPVRWCILVYSLLGERRGRPSCHRWIRGSRWGRWSCQLWNWGQWSQGGDFMRGGSYSVSTEYIEHLYYTEAIIVSHTVQVVAQLKPFWQ